MDLESSVKYSNLQFVVVNMTVYAGRDDKSQAPLKNTFLAAGNVRHRFWRYLAGREI